MFDVNSTSHQFFYDEISDVCYRTLDFLGYSGYRVGDDGSVQTRRTTNPNLLNNNWSDLLTDPSSTYGHCRVTLCGPNKKHKRYSVHHLVLFAFVGPRPESMECRHLNGDAKNNRVENLRWGTKQENIDDRVSHGHNRDQNGAKNNMAVLDESIVLEIRRCYAAGEFVSQRQIAEHYNVSPALICNILKRKIWTHI